MCDTLVSAVGSRSTETAVGSGKSKMYPPVRWNFFNMSVSKIMRKAKKILVKAGDPIGINP